MKDQEMVPVYTTYDPTQAEILKNALQEEGIPCFIEGENQGGLSGVLLIRLFVNSENAEQARKFLDQHEAT